MRRLLPLAAMLLATLAATPAAGWEWHGHGHRWRPAPSWQPAHPHRGCHQPWHFEARRHHGRGEGWGYRGDARRHFARPRYGRDEGWGYHRGWHDDRRHLARPRYGRDEGWGYRRGW